MDVYIKACLEKGDAPIAEKYILPRENVEALAADTNSDAPQNGEDLQEPTERPPREKENEAEEQKNGGKKSKKRARGQFSCAERKKIKREEEKLLDKTPQLCSIFAYTNVCPRENCKFDHDKDAFLASHPRDKTAICPVYHRLPKDSELACAAGLNCKWASYHIVDNQNIDKQGRVVTPGSACVRLQRNTGDAPNEMNAIPFDMRVQLRRKQYDFSKSKEAWLGPEVERRPLSLKGKRILAPLTTIGNLPFRRLCVKLGAEVTVGEMSLCASLLEGQVSEMALLKRHESEKCFGVQVTGGNPEYMCNLSQFLAENGQCDFVDINAACPLDGMHQKGCGSILMNRTQVLEKMVRGMHKVLAPHNIALTAKIRMSHFGNPTAHTLVPKLAEWGASGVFLHGRTAKQRYTKLADWDYVGQCRDALYESGFSDRCQLVGCGDILTWEAAQKQSTYADGVMIARGAMVKPWLFTEIAEQRTWDITASERFGLLRDFVGYGLDHWGADAKGVENTRRFLLEWLSFYTRYIPHGLLVDGAPPYSMTWRPPPYKGRDDLESLLASPSIKDWIYISEMLLGKVPDNFVFVPKHKSQSYSSSRWSVDHSTIVAPFKLWE